MTTPPFELAGAQVPVGSRGAIACYRRLGFHEVGVLRSYQRLANGSWADGLLMELLAGDPCSL